MKVTWTWNKALVYFIYRKYVKDRVVVSNVFKQFTTQLERHMCVAAGRFLFSWQCGVWLLEAQQSLFMTVIQRQFKTKIHHRYWPLLTELQSHTLLSDRHRSAFIKPGAFDTLTVLCWPDTSCVQGNYITFSYRIFRWVVPWREVGRAPRLYSIHFIRCLIRINICCAAPILQLHQRAIPTFFKLQSP